MSRLADEMYETVKDLHEIGLLSQAKMDEISLLYKDAIKQAARHKAPPREKRIGAAKGKFQSPINLDKGNAEISTQFSHE